VTLATHRRVLELLDPDDLVAIDAWGEVADRLQRRHPAARAGGALATEAPAVTPGAREAGPAHRAPAHRPPPA
jgi:hypothetical protein